MNAELNQLAQQLEQARTPEEVFGKLDGSQAEQAAGLKTIYHQMAKKAHPDAYPRPEDQAVAHVAFSRLSSWFASAAARIRAGIYGKHGAPLETWRVVLPTPKGAYILENEFWEGPLYTCYPGTFQHKDGSTAVLLKFTRNPHDNDLAENEARALQILRVGKAARKFSPYLPNLLDAFRYQEESAARQVNVLERPPGWYSLLEVRQAYPTGIDPRDMAWIWRRVLVALGFAHLNGVIHGAVLPGHIYLHPEKHGLMLSEWSYAVCAPAASGAYIQALVPDYEGWYPAEVHRREPPLAGTDIDMAARCMIFLLGGDPIARTLPDSVPQPLRSFFKGCTLPGKRSRPQDAWALKTEFDDLIRRLWGERTFHPFSMKVDSVQF